MQAPKPRLPSFGGLHDHTSAPSTAPTPTYPGDAFTPLRLDVERYGQILGLPPRAITFSNSERLSRGCRRKWLYSYGYRLRSNTRQRPLDYGSAWALLMEDLYLWFKHNPAQPYPMPYEPQAKACPWCVGVTPDDYHEHDAGSVSCVRCTDTRISVLHAVQAAWLEHADHLESKYGADAADELRQDSEILERAFRGYLETYGQRLVGYEVLGVEYQISIPVLRSDGKPFASRVPLKQDEGSYRIVYPGETPDLWATLPWYQVGRIDALLRDSRGMIWIVDFKSSRGPDGYAEKVAMDPQTVGYAYMVQSALDRGLLPFKGIVLGMTFDVSSSERQSYPKRLKQDELAKRDPLREQGYTHKTPRLSLDAGAKTPSWLYREALASLAAEQGPWPPVDVHEYEAHLAALPARVDKKLYVKQAVYATNVKLRQYAIELQGIAESIAEDLRTLPKLTDEDATYRGFPRTPLCVTNGQSCAFLEVCSGGRLKDSLSTYTVGEGQRWIMDSQHEDLNSK